MGNFAGPVAYWLPEYWQRRQSGWEQQGAQLEDIGTVKSMKGGAGAFEWNTMFSYRDGNGDYKLPKMAFPAKKDGRSVLYGWARRYDADNDLLEPIEWALSQGGLNTSTVMPRGKRMPCSSATSAANIRVDGGKGVNVGKLETTIEGGDCVWAIDVDNCHDGDAACDVPQYVSANLKPLAPSQASDALRKQDFETKSSWGPWDALSHPPSGGCASSPGPASSIIYCSKTTTGSWLAWRWYKFTEQPAMARTNMTDRQKSFLQTRVETLHKMLTRESRWLKARGAATEGLANIDAALQVNPPAGMEFGYVPIAFYEGPSKTQGCQAPPPVPPSPPTPPAPTPTPTPKPTPSPSSDGIHLYEANGDGQLFLSSDDFAPNYQSGRKGAPAWDACGGSKFDNGRPVWVQGSGSFVGFFKVVGNYAVRTSRQCGLSFSYDNLPLSKKEYSSADGKIALEQGAYFEASQTTVV